MDSSTREKELSNALVCSVCLETNTKPQVLPCGHSFCVNCLRGLPRDDDKIACPRCRKQRGFKRFTKNFSWRPLTVMAGDPSCWRPCTIVPDTRYLQINYSDKGTTIIPASGATGDCGLRYPTGAAYCSQTNTILVADNGNSRIMRFDMDGSNGRQFVRHGVIDYGHYRPWDVATSQSGRVFVTDSLNERVLVFTLDGDYVASIGSRGTGDGQFGDVCGITCHNGYVLVCDWGNQRVTMVTEGGDFVRHIVSGLSAPLYVAVGPGDTIYVTNYDITHGRYHSNVHVFLWSGLPIRQFGDCEGASGTMPGGVTVDHQGYVCVVWCHHHRVDVYDPQGELHATFGKQDCGPGELWPRGLELLPDGRVLVCDYGNHRLQIF